MTTTAIISGRLESIAANRLTKLEESIGGAHFFEKHGAQTSLASQKERILKGANPTTGVIETYPNGKLRKPSSATRFLSNRDQINAIERAETIFRNTGQKTLAEKPIKFGYIMGEGYKKVGLKYGQSYSGQVWFKGGKVNTAFPIWGK